MQTQKSVRSRFLLLAALCAVSLLQPLTAHAQGGTPAFDPAALLSEGKTQIGSFILAISGTVIGLIILTAGFKKTVSYVKRMFKSA